MTHGGINDNMERVGWSGQRNNIALSFKPDTFSTLHIAVQQNIKNQSQQLKSCVVALSLVEDRNAQQGYQGAR